ncbi:MAG: hypothetical protein ACK5DE_02540 [Bacteroidota bacterium]
MTNAEIIAQSLMSRLTAEGMQINQVTQTEQNGNVEVTIETPVLGIKSLTIHMKEVSRPLGEDFGLLGEDEGYVDHIDYYTMQSVQELVPARDEEM